MSNNMEENYVKGTCQTMCPVKEAQLRQRENLLHKFEMKAGTECNGRPEYDIRKIIKSFSRSAAGAETTNPANLRPFPVLLKTIEHLYREVFPFHREKPVTVYDFMFDRFRAVRQDAVIQNLSSKQTIQILEPIVRFLIYFGYILTEEEEIVFDAHINNVHLQECMKTLLVCYNEIGDVGCGTRWEIESAYVLFNLGNIKPMTRGYGLYETADKIYLHCLETSLQWFLKNYIRVFNMLRTLPPLLLCVVNSCIPEMRKYALKSMAYGYSCSNSCYPVYNLRNLLVFESDIEVVDECRNYNIKVSNGKINFLKNDFNTLAKCRKSVRLKWVDEMLLKCNLIDLLYKGSD